MLIIAFEEIVARPLFSESVHYFQFFGHFVLLNTTKYLQICFFILVLHYRLLKRVLKKVDIIIQEMDYFLERMDSTLLIEKYYVLN